MTKPNSSLDRQGGQEDKGPIDKNTSQPLEPGDYYYEGPYMVFTEAYHRKRGYCCNSGCRHCPYR